MSTIPTIQLFRNNNILDGRAAAVGALEGQKANVPDGGLILARYSGGTSPNVIKTILGIVRYDGVNSDITIFDVEGAAENTAAAITTAIGQLHTSDIAVDGQYVTAITQTNGLVSVKLGGVAAANVSVADASNKFSGTTVEAVLLEIQNSLDSAIGQGGSVGTQISTAINKLDSSKSGSTAHVSVKVDQVDGKISAVTVSEDDIASATLLGTSGDTSTAKTAFGYIAKEAADRADAINALNLTSVGGTGKVIATVSQTNGKVSATTTDLTAVNVGATASTGTTTAVAVNGDTVAAQISSLATSIKSVSSAAKSYSISAITEENGLAALNLGTNVKEAYALVDEDDKPVGEYIKIYKDSSLKEVNLVGQTLNFTYILANGSESTVGVDVSTFLAESEFKNGLEVVNHLVNVKIDTASEGNFLTVSANGVKLSGIQSAINTATGNVNTALNAEIAARKKVDGISGDAYTAKTDANYISDANSLFEADVKLDVAITTVATALNKETNERTSADEALSNRLGTGITTDSTATEQLKALSGTSSDTSSATSVNGAKKYAQEYADSKIASLDATVTSVSGNSKTEAIKIEQTDGKISSITLGTFDCGVY